MFPSCRRSISVARTAWRRFAMGMVFVVGTMVVTSLGTADEPLAADIAYFETNVRPLLSQRCYACHSEQGGKKEGDLRLDHREHWMRGGENGPLISPGNLEQSLLWRVVQYEDPDLQMPPSGKLADRELEILKRWILMGAPAPSDENRSVDGHPSDPVVGKSHWAFRPLVERPVPTVKQEAWSRTDIDRWIASRLENEGLQPGERASHDVLVRRISFLLTGLPPTEQDWIDREDSAESLTLFVDRLLASPEFGRRWGRHWLDLARYADSNGLDENFLFREAWRYRNWVIDAIDADLPFDRFLLEQIAGDLLPYDSIAQRDRQRIATGFLVVGPKVLLGVPPDRQKMDVADEQLETIGRTVLGQTLGCARCHDHKFDPIPTEDYYALAGILTSSQVMERRFMLNEQRVMERLVGLGPEGESLDESYESFWREQPNLKKRRDKIKEVLELLKKGEANEWEAKLAKEPESFAEEAKKGELSIELRLEAQKALLEEVDRTLKYPPKIPGRAMVAGESDKIVDESIRLAGKYDALGTKVPRGFLRVLQEEPTTGSLPEHQSGRKELGKWLTDPQSRAGWLMARVQVNRVWHHLIGCGLVRTVDNFGRTGEEPTHPELLDALAIEWLREGMSLKALVRKIVLTETFALSSHYDPQLQDRDPENRFLGRAHRRRLDPESLRDAMLIAAGSLDRGRFDSTVDYLGDQATAVGKNLVRRRTDFPCRSLYLPVIRNDLPELLDVFDFANPQATTGARPKTNVPTQGLFMLNDPLVMDAAAELARRIVAESSSTSLDRLVEHAWQRVFGTDPSDLERQSIADFLDRIGVRGSEDDKQGMLRGLTLVCHALFASSRFQFLE